MGATSPVTPVPLMLGRLSLRTPFVLILLVFLLYMVYALLFAWASPPFGVTPHQWRNPKLPITLPQLKKHTFEQLAEKLQSTCPDMKEIQSQEVELIEQLSHRKWHWVFRGELLPNRTAVV